MDKVISKDGTPIAFERTGNGPVLIFVDGALCYRGSGQSAAVAKALAAHFTVVTYDRRGRGDSGNRGPYAVAREVEDLEALIAAAGGSVFVYGVSSGAALALEAATRAGGIARLALFEAPFIVDDSRAPVPADFVQQLDDAVAAGRRGDAVKLFMKQVGVPPAFLLLMRLMPAWPKLTAIAHTIAYDIRIMNGNQAGHPLPASRWAGATMPALVMDGGKSPVWMRNATRSLATILPNAQYRTLPGQTHMIKAAAVVAPLVEFFKT